MNPAFGSGSDPSSSSGNPGPDDTGGDAPVKWRHSDCAPSPAHPIPGNKLFQWSQNIILYGHQRNTNWSSQKFSGRKYNHSEINSDIGLGLSKSTNFRKSIFDKRGFVCNNNSQLLQLYFWWNVYEVIFPLSYLFLGVTNLCWKLGFCPLTIFSTDKDPPEGGEKGNRWQSETINSWCCSLPMFPGSCHNHRGMSPAAREPGWRGWGVWELGQMSGEWVWSVAF